MDKGKKPIKPGALKKYDRIHMDLREIIREQALRYLPAKSLFRCTAVCRDWKLQISTPFFEHSQSNSFCSISGLFCQPLNSPPSFISLDPTAYGVPDPELKFLPEPVDVRASSNGLLCCQGHNRDKAYYICNPVNKQWKKLPKPEADHGSDPALVLAFEPSLLNFVSDYKLICAFPSPDFDDAYEFEIYSSAKDSWKIASEICFGKRVLKRGGVYVGGVVYWSSDQYTLIAFNLKKNRVSFIPCYCFLGTSPLGVIDGKLCTSSMQARQIDVSVLSNMFANTMHMGAESKTWETKQSILVNAAGISFSLHEYGPTVLAIGGDVILVHDGERIYSYSLRKKETEMLSTEAKFSSSCVYVPYINNLVSL